MSNTTTTTTPNKSATTPEDITARLNSWAQSQQLCWVVLPTPSGVCVEVYGRISTLPSNRSLYTLHGERFLSTVTFPIMAVESVGMTCIFLRH
jgi:hypothetical protein